MKYILPTFISTIILCLAYSCKESRSPFCNRVIEAAKCDVAKVEQTSEGTMEREKAVLAIRVREQSLRAHGYNEEADLYIETAGTMLIDSLNIIEDRSFLD